MAYYATYNTDRSFRAHSMELPMNIKSARNSLHQHLDSESEKSHRRIPTAQTLQSCFGICYIRFTKAGLVVSGLSGSGLLMNKINRGSDEEHWSPPAPVRVSGIGLGLEAGLETVEQWIVFQREEEQQDLLSGGQVSLGAEATGVIGSHSLLAEHSMGKEERKVSSAAGGAYAGVGYFYVKFHIDQEEIMDYYHGNFDASFIAKGKAGLKRVAQDPFMQALVEELTKAANNSA